MSDDDYSSGHGGGGNSAMEALVARGFAEMDKADQNADTNDGKTAKLFGLFEVPAGFASIAEGLWNESAHVFTGWLEQHTEAPFTAAGTALGLKGDTLRRGVAGASLLTSTAIKSAPYINPFFESFRNQYDKRKHIARRIAPVLDDVRGGHSVNALMGVSEGQNEMIYAARRRLTAQADTENMNNLITMVNVLPGFVPDLVHMQHKWNNTAPVADKDIGGVVRNVGGMFSRVGAGPLARVLINGNNRKLKKRFTSEFSALDMVVSLVDQVEHDPKAERFELPDKSDSIDLESYLVRLLIQHQKDMADLAPEYTELRLSLKEDIAAIAKPLADAIRNGEMAPLELVRMVGEGKIIKKKGRAIATPEEIDKLIQRDKPQTHKYTSVDSKEFFANASYNKEELKTAIGSLKGDEKEIFASMFPDSILEEVGMQKAEIEAMREHMVKRYEHHLAEMVSGAAAKTDDELKKDGLSSAEVKLLRDAAETLSQKGETAITEVKGTGSTGVEQAVSNLVVPSISGDKAYFGTLLSRGQEALKSKVDEVVKADDKPAKPEEKSDAADHVERLEESRSAKSEAQAERA